ncbi:DUF3987 domain-containing protein [Legionella geestiana]|uniref:YfjI family protein n=1 Tax=Legionella geestiana TaxID=45065 RepID=UPI001091AD7B|nr:YfjI family protein [Legionella geestiana]QDQ40183.1 DUF3987 domain-containing protein [Legionella geestiana]
MNNLNESGEESASTDSSHKNHNWEYPVSLTPILAPDIPYPVHALPSILQQVVTSYQKYGQQPTALVACSAMANLSLACQALANVGRDHHLISPVSLYFLVVASSGERKSAADSVFSSATRAWESKVRLEREPEVETALSLHQAWQMERDGLLSQIKRSMMSGEDTTFYKDLLARLIRIEPDIPLQPTLYFEDATQEALAMHLAHGWPSASLWSDEAGIVLGSHSMQANPMKFVALLNRLWDGKSFTAHRKTTNSFTLQHRRLTLNLMMQPLLLKNLTSQHNNISRQSGFLPRCLLAYPKSAMGARFYQEPPEARVYLNEYEARIQNCLNESQHLNRKGCNHLPTLLMARQAKHSWVQFFNAIESGLKIEGQWSAIQDFASKAGENVARLAALFHLFEGKSGDISTESVEQAIQIIHWHLQETRRLLNAGNQSSDMTDAVRLLDWLKEKGLHKTTARDIQRLSPLRDIERRDNAIAILVEHNLVRLSKDGNKIILELNPHCTQD